MARIVRFHEIGEPDVLKIEQTEIPAPSKGEVQIAVKAIGLNRAEALFRRGHYMEFPELPARLGYEAAGTVAAIGPDVTGLSVGDVVSVIPSFSFNAYGTYGDRVNLPSYAVVKHPASLSFEQAAAAWMQYLTPYGALIETAGLTKGDTVLIPAASSSVGLATIQIANKVGAVPVALTRDSSKKAALLAAGAAHVIVTTEQDVVAEVQAITGGKGARVIFDPVGGSTIAKLAEAAAPGGIIVIYGALNQEPTNLPLITLLGKGLTVRGYTMLEVVTNPERVPKAIGFISSGLADGSLKPIIDKTFPFDQIVEAHRYLESNQQVGKVVVTV